MKKPLTIAALVMCLGCAVAARFTPSPWAQVLGTIGCLSVGLAIYNVLTQKPSKPFEREFGRANWTPDGAEVPNHFIRVPANEHRRGKHPQVEFAKTNGPYTSTALVYEIEADGSIVIRNDPNSTIFQFKEFKVIIR